MLAKNGFQSSMYAISTRQKSSEKVRLIHTHDAVLIKNFCKRSSPGTFSTVNNKEYEWGVKSGCLYLGQKYVAQTK